MFPLEACRAVAGCITAGGERSAARERVTGVLAGRRGTARPAGRQGAPNSAAAANTTAALSLPRHSLSPAVPPPLQYPTHFQYTRTAVGCLHVTAQTSLERSGISPVRIRQLYTHSYTVQLHRAVTSTILSWSGNETLLQRCGGGRGLGSSQWNIPRAGSGRVQGRHTGPHYDVTVVGRAGGKPS